MGAKLCRLSYLLLFLYGSNEAVDNLLQVAVLGLSQILCKHRNAVQIEQNLFKAEVAQAAAALFSK